jgi:hypothetical protein
MFAADFDLMKQDESDVEGDQDSSVSLRGPHGWLNWNAERQGYPRRKEPHPESIVIRPIWEEFAIYTDTFLSGGWLSVGPYEFIEVDHVDSAAVGHSRKLLILRAWDHIPDTPPSGTWEPDTDIQDWVGGDIGDELAALLGLALGRRFRSGGLVRQGLPIETHPVGLPDEARHHEPALQPPRRHPMIATIADATSLQSAEDLLESYPAIPAADAVALVRSARQYVDGLWLADADPRLAWIKLIGALEAAANRRDDLRQGDPVDQLKRHKPKLYRTLKDGPKDALVAVAEETARLFRSEVKLRSFVRIFDPGSPTVRPAGSGWQFDWSDLDDALRVIYNHRSRDLHDGIPFPWPLCEPPHMTEDGIPSERTLGLGIAGFGGRWSAEELPMHLHVFAHVVGGSLRNWWSSMKPKEHRED